VAYEQSGISCDKFQTKENVCATLTEQINAAQTVGQKAAKAQELIEVAEELLACEEYEDASLGCQYCRNLYLLRMRTARLILKMASLDD